MLFILSLEQRELDNQKYGPPNHERVEYTDFLDEVCQVCGGSLGKHFHTSLFLKYIDFIIEEHHEGKYLRLLLNKYNCMTPLFVDYNVELVEIMFKFEQVFRQRDQEGMQGNYSQLF